MEEDPNKVTMIGVLHRGGPLSMFSFSKDFRWTVVVHSLTSLWILGLLFSDT
jgi:hypothetical protein